MKAVLIVALVLTAGCGARFYEDRAEKLETRIQADHPSWDVPVVENVARGMVAPGMTKEQVRTAWGAPRRVNRYQSQSSYVEQWVYGAGGEVAYLHFSGDTVDSMTRLGD